MRRIFPVYEKGGGGAIPGGIRPLTGACLSRVISGKVSHPDANRTRAEDDESDPRSRPAEKAGHCPAGIPCPPATFTDDPLDRSPARAGGHAYTGTFRGNLRQGGGYSGGKIFSFFSENKGLMG